MRLVNSVSFYQQIAPNVLVAISAIVCLELVILFVLKAFMIIYVIYLLHFLFI